MCNKGRKGKGAKSNAIYKEIITNQKLKLHCPEIDKVILHFEDVIVKICKVSKNKLRNFIFSQVSF